MENTTAIINITIMPICTPLVSTLILFAAFLPPRVNGGTEGKGAVTGGGVKGGCVIGIVVAGLAPAMLVPAPAMRDGIVESCLGDGYSWACAAAPAMLACAGEGVRGNGVRVTRGCLWTVYLGIPPVSGKLPGFQSLVEILAAG
jgi:hypothetical protein